MPTLWPTTTASTWQRALDEYPSVVVRQGVARLPALDAWYHDELPAAIAARPVAHATAPELVRLIEWKMARGVWRAPNLVLVRGNDPDAVVTASREAFARRDDGVKGVARLAELAGVGPATASALMAAVAPARFPFFDELVAAQVPGLGPVKWTMGYYARYAAALRERAAVLGDGWTAAMVERALWSAVGGKVG